MKHPKKKDNSGIKKEAKLIDLSKKPLPLPDIKSVYLDSLTEIDSLLNNHFEESE